MIKAMKISMCTYLMLLLQLFYFGGKDVELRIAISNIQMYFILSCPARGIDTVHIHRLCKVQFNAYESLIERFKDEVLRSNTLCAPALRHLIDIHLLV